MVPMEVPGKLEVQTSRENATTITLDGDEKSISIHGNISTIGGDVIFHDGDWKERVRIGTTLGIFLAKDAIGKSALAIWDAGIHTGLYLGTHTGDGGNKAGHINIRDITGIDTIDLDGSRNSVILRDGAGKDS